MNETVKFTDYKQFKVEFDQEIGRQAEGFVRMGYLLKVARDTNILWESGYKSIAEFAWGEYKLPDYTVTNMIKINDRYSEGGYSERIADRYRGFGSSLLAEMLTLSDQVIDALPDGIKREEIRNIKSEIKEENRITDLEVLMEEPEQQEAENNLERVLLMYFYENRREYPKLHRMILDGELKKRNAVDLLAPNGSAVKFARVRGTGKFMLSIKGEDQDLELLNVRSNEGEKYTWDDCIRALGKMFRGSRESRKDWEFIYGEAYQEGETNATPTPQPTTAPKPDKTYGAAEKAPGKEHEKELVKEEPKEKTTELKAEEPVQQSIESYKEVLPDGYQPVPEVITREEVELWKNAAQSAARLLHTLEGNDWNPDCIKLVHEMCTETANLKVILDTLEERMEHEID